jgi:hypothetical protein
MKDKAFTLTEGHLKLLRAANVSWDGMEFGAPGIDPKRPYGNSNVTHDIAEILGWPFVKTEDGSALTADQGKQARRLHREMETALQIVLATATFEAGDYVASGFGKDWRRV